MSYEVAFEVESALIDLANRTGANLTNEVTGHNSIENGMMSTDDIWCHLIAIATVSCCTDSEQSRA